MSWGTWSERFGCAPRASHEQPGGHPVVFCGNTRPSAATRAPCPRWGLSVHDGQCHLCDGKRGTLHPSSMPWPCYLLVALEKWINCSLQSLSVLIAIGPDYKAGSQQDALDQKEPCLGPFELPPPNTTDRWLVPHSSRGQKFNSRAPAWAGEGLLLGHRFRFVSLHGGRVEGALWGLS